MDKIRNQNYGRIYVNISDPISVRKKVNKRNVPEWGLPSYRFNLDTEEKKNIYSFAKELVCKQQEDAITPISAILAAVLSVREIDLQQLTEYVALFNSLLKKYGTPCFIQGNDIYFIFLNLKLRFSFILLF